MSAPPSNLGNGCFQLTQTGAVATRRIPPHTNVGVFLYYQWDVVGVLTRDLAVGVPHSIVNANCKLHVEAGDPSTVYLRSTREIVSGARLLLDYRCAPWWITAPPRHFKLPRALLATPCYHLGPSTIHGSGIMASVALPAGADIGCCIAFHWWWMPVVTREFGRHLNHSRTPTSRLEWRGYAKGWWAVAMAPLRAGEEITVDYRTLPWYCRGEPAGGNKKSS